MNRVMAVLFGAALIGCGGRVVGEEGNNPIADAQGDRDSTDSDLVDSNPGVDVVIEDVPADSPCAPVHGLRRCGGVCGASCGPGEKCIDFVSIDTDTFEPGVCVVPGKPNAFSGTSALECNVCDNETDLCVLTGVLVCVPATLCGSLTPKRPPTPVRPTSPCTYQDKSRWTPTDVIPTPPCPAEATKLGLCGGTCGDCQPEQTCTGRSPVHPFGVCAARKLDWPKRVDAPNRCGSGAPCPDGFRCVTHVVGDSGVKFFADYYGFCAEATRCESLVKAFPSGYRCE